MLRINCFIRWLKSQKKVKLAQVSTVQTVPTAENQSAEENPSNSQQIQRILSGVFGATNVKNVNLLQQHAEDMERAKASIARATHKQYSFTRFYNYINDLNAVYKGALENKLEKRAMAPPFFIDLVTSAAIPKTEPGLPLEKMLEILDNVTIPNITGNNVQYFRDIKNRGPQ